MHLLLLFTFLFLPGICFSTRPTTVKKMLLEHPVIGITPLSDTFFADRTVSETNLGPQVKGDKGVKDLSRGSGGNINTDVRSTVEYITSTVDAKTGNSEPTSYVIHTIQVQGSDPNSFTKTNLEFSRNGFEPEGTGKPVLAKNEVCPVCKSPLLSSNKRDPKKNVDVFCPCYEQMTSLEFFDKANPKEFVCPACKQLQPRLFPDKINPKEFCPACKQISPKLFFNPVYPKAFCPLCKQLVPKLFDETQNKKSFFPLNKQTVPKFVDKVNNKGFCPVCKQPSPVLFARKTSPKEFCPFCKQPTSILYKPNSKEEFCPCCKTFAPNAAGGKANSNKEFCPCCKCSSNKPPERNQPQLNTKPTTPIKRNDQLKKTKEQTNFKKSEALSANIFNENNEFDDVVESSIQSPLSIDDDYKFEDYFKSDFFKDDEASLDAGLNEKKFRQVRNESDKTKKASSRLLADSLKTQGKNGNTPSKAYSYGKQGHLLQFDFKDLDKDLKDFPLTKDHLEGDKYSTQSKTNEHDNEATFQSIFDSVQKIFDTLDEKSESPSSPSDKRTAEASVDKLADFDLQHRNPMKKKGRDNLAVIPEKSQKPRFSSTQSNGKSSMNSEVEDLELERNTKDVRTKGGSNKLEGYLSNSDINTLKDGEKIMKTFSSDFNNIEKLFRELEINEISDKDFEDNYSTKGHLSNSYPQANKLMVQRKNQNTFSNNGNKSLEPSAKELKPLSSSVGKNHLFDKLKSEAKPTQRESVLNSNKLVSKVSRGLAKPSTETFDKTSSTSTAHKGAERQLLAAKMSAQPAYKDPNLEELSFWNSLKNRANSVISDPFMGYAGLA